MVDTNIKIKQELKEGCRFFNNWCKAITAHLDQKDKCNCDKLIKW